MYKEGKYELDHDSIYGSSCPTPQRPLCLNKRLISDQALDNTLLSMIQFPNSVQ